MPRRRDSKISRAIAAAIHEKVRLEKREKKRELIYGKPTNNSTVFDANSKLSVVKDQNLSETQSKTELISDNRVTEDLLQITVDQSDIDFIQGLSHSCH